MRHTVGTLAVREFPATTMIHVHHVPQHGAADRVAARLANSTAAAVLAAADTPSNPCR